MFHVKLENFTVAFCWVSFYVKFLWTLSLVNRCSHLKKKKKLMSWLAFNLSHLFDVLMLVDTWREGRREAFVDVWLGCQLLQGLHAVFSEQLLFRLLFQTM